MFSPGLLRGLAALYPEVKTRRGLHNKALQAHAIGLLCDSPEFERVCPGRAELLAGVDAWSWEVLTELGRIEDDGYLRDVARLICRTPELSRSEAVEVVRFNRMVAYVVAIVEGEEPTARLPSRFDER